jgi:hypothetical protein
MRHVPSRDVLQKGYLVYTLGAANKKQVDVELRKRGFLKMDSNAPSAAVADPTAAGGKGTWIAA